MHIFCVSIIVRKIQRSTSDLSSLSSQFIHQHIQFVHQHRHVQKHHLIIVTSFEQDLPDCLAQYNNIAFLWKFHAESRQQNAEFILLCQPTIFWQKRNPANIFRGTKSDRIYFFCHCILFNWIPISQRWLIMCYSDVHVLVLGLIDYFNCLYIFIGVGWGWLNQYHPRRNGFWRFVKQFHKQFLF